MDSVSVGKVLIFSVGVFKCLKDFFCIKYSSYCMPNEKSKSFARVIIFPCTPQLALKHLNCPVVRLMENVFLSFSE